MKGTNYRKVALPIALLALFVMTTSTEVMAWQRNISRTGPGGATSSRNIITNRTENGYNRSSTVTGPQGNSATRSAQGQWDPASQTWSKNVTSTGSNAQNATRTTTVTGTGSGYNKNTTVTGPQGNTATRQVSGQWNPATKTWTKSSTTTGSGQ